MKAFSVPFMARILGCYTQSRPLDQRMVLESLRVEGGRHNAAYKRTDPNC